MLFKICKRCNKELEATTDNFYKSKSNKDGLHSYCKDCVKEKSVKWRTENYEQYYKGVKKRVNRLKENQEWVEYHRRKAKEQRESGKQKIWRDKNKDKLAEYYRYKFQHKTHKITELEWISCKEYFNNKCAYCELPIEEHYVTYKGKLILSDFHKEHVEHNGSNDLSNCVPSCKSCNSKKWEYNFNDWYNKTNENYSEERYNKIITWLNNDYKLYIEINNIK